MKRIVSFFVCVALILIQLTVMAENETQIDGVEAKACILIEQSTGTVLREMNADEQLPIASVTKIMTMLLIMEEIDSGRLSLDDMVTVSENAMSYGGSTMFLETGEQLSVNDMLKGIAVASANDGCVAMAEHICGSESAFVDKMNKRAEELGMNNTHFVNTNGLDDDNHFSSARDVAIMSRELLNHPKITDYTSIWTDELREGKFSLANTNKLIRFYTGANGLKTGSTSKALCCLSASAVRNDMQLIAVVLGAPTSAKRFSSAKALLDFGFATYRIEKLVCTDEEISEASVTNGVEKTVKAAAAEERVLLREKQLQTDTEKRVYIDNEITAPVHKGDVIGRVDFVSGEENIASVDLVAVNDVNKKNVFMIMRDIALGFM
jgi:D-alanyl-D-alanine carboxypeptidase (penicillin-binding protein 5/6)